MNSSQSRPEIYRVLIHPAMSISVSATGILAAVWLIGVNLGIPAPRIGTIVAIILAPFLEAVVGNVVYRKRAGIANRVRELVIYLLLVYAGFSLARGGPLAARFTPTPDQILPVVSVALTWLIAFAFHNRLRGREALLRTFHGAHGAELRHAVLDRQHDMALTVGQLRKARSLIGTVFVVLCMLAIFGSLDFFGVSVLRAGSGAFVCLVLYGISSISVIGTLNMFIEEYAANGEGLTVPIRFQRRRSLAAAALIAFVLVLAFALSRAESLLPLEAIADFFRWLAGLFEREPADMEPPPALQQRPQQQPSSDITEMLQDLEANEPPLWLRVLARLLERLAVSTLIVGGLVLLFGPLFSRSFRHALTQLKPGQFIRELLRNLRRRLRILGKFLKYGLRRGRRGRDSEDDAAGEPPDAWRASQWRPGLRKRRQMDRVVRVFVDVTRWGEKHGLRYRRTDAAREYLVKIAELRPERYADAISVAETFCEARFSRHTVPGDRMREYVRAAKRITSNE